MCSAANGSLDLTQIEERYYQALLQMKRLEFDEPLPWTTQSLYDWFVGTVDGVYMGADTSYCCNPRRVINIVAWGVLDDLGHLTYPLELLVHEARHIEAGGHKCNGRDLTIQEMGASGVQYYLMEWIGLHGTSEWLSQYDRQYALNRAAQIRSGGFCYECSGPQ